MRNRKVGPEPSQGLVIGFSMSAHSIENHFNYCRLSHLCVPLHRLYVDGPFGSPFEESLNYEVSLCVAGGIGVTPFASVLNTLLYVILIRFISPDKELPIFWTSPF